jgi:hypothetical protein
MRQMLRAVLVLGALGGARVLPAQSGTAVKTGEKALGSTKECYYDFRGKSYVKTIDAYALCPYSVQVSTGPAQATATPAPPPTTQPGNVIAFKTGENTTGMTKQCYYAFGASEYTTTLNSVQLCPLSIQVSLNTAPTRPSSSYQAPRPATLTAFKTGERTTGMTKQCYYSFGASAYTKTIQSVALCPLSIQVATH